VPRHLGGIVLKDNLFTPKAFYNLAQGNTLGLGEVWDATLKALNMTRSKTTTERIIKPFQGI
jgi:hypothetical protein